jgi:hypothetical protein
MFFVLPPVWQEASGKSAGGERKAVGAPLEPVGRWRSRPIRRTLYPSAHAVKTVLAANPAKKSLKNN